MSPFFFAVHFLYKCLDSLDFEFKVIALWVEATTPDEGRNEFLSNNMQGSDMMDLDFILVATSGV